MGCSVSRFTIFSAFHSHPLLNQPPSLILRHHASSSSSNTTPHSHHHSSPPPPPSGGNSHRRAMSIPSPLVHHPPSGNGDSDHLVFLTSTSYGSALHKSDQQQRYHHSPDSVPSPDSVINAWELMDGLDDSNSDLAHSPLPTKCSSQNQGSGDGIEKPASNSKSKPLWKHFSEESFLLKLDPIIVSSYRRALCARKSRVETKELHLPAESKEKSNSPDCQSSPMPPISADAGGVGGGIVVYFTSLRGIRKTYEECCSVRTVLRGLGVAVDERDVSMHSAYRKELRGMLLPPAAAGGGRLPQVFIGGKHVGGADEIRRMNDSGELSELVKGFRPSGGGVCGSCGDARFVMCWKCNGSRKVFDEKEQRLRRCSDCNENGLIRCRSCSVC
ncbi:Uncharacterized protein At3g28850 [Linum grandiflorum]